MQERSKRPQNRPKAGRRGGGAVSPALPVPAGERARVRNGGYGAAAVTAAPGAVNRAYTVIFGALVVFFFVGSLLVGLGGAIEAKGPSKDRGAYQASASVRENAENVAQTADANASAGFDGGEAHRYYVLPLSDGMQDTVYRLCDEYDVPPELVFGIISANAVTSTPYDGSEGGGMGPPSDSAEWCAAQLGIEGRPDYEQSLECGIFMLREYCHKYDDVNAVVMCYELGENEALARIENGQTSTPYSRLVKREASTLTERPPKK